MDAEERSPDIGLDGLTDATRGVLRWRYDEAREAGMSIVEAKLYAESNIDASLLREAVRRGCPKDLLAKVVL